MAHQSLSYEATLFLRHSRHLKENPLNIDLNFYKLIFIENNSGTCSIEGKNIEGTKGSVFFIAPHESYEINDLQNCDFWILAFEDGYFQKSTSKLPITDIKMRPFLRYGENTIFHFKTIPSTQEYITHLLQMIDLEIHENSPHRELLKMHLESLLTVISRDLTRNKLDTPLHFPILVQKTFELIEEHHTTSLSTSTLAQKLSVSTAHLSHIVSLCTGYTISHWIQLRKMISARELLLDHKYSIKEISYQLGYSSPNRFNESFIKVHGVSPSAWLKKHENSPNTKNNLNIN